MTTTWPAIPSWEETDLDQLSSAGELNDVNPVVLGVIDDAESGGEGGGINSEGYGGFFGLGADQTYPGGATTTAMMSSTSSAAFEAQAEIASSAFAQYLTEAGGNPVTAEEIYQSGSASGPTEGSELMAEYLGTGSGTSGTGSAGSSSPASASDTSFLGNIFGGAASSAAGAVWAEVAPFLVKAILVCAGLGILILAAYKAASPRIRSAAQSVAPAVAAAA